MGIIVVILIIVLIFVIVKNSGTNKSNNARIILGNQRVSERFKDIVDTISEIDHYFMEYDIYQISPVQDNICSRRYQNVIILMHVYGDTLYLDWKYKFYQQEVSRRFSHSAINFSTQEQREFAKASYYTMDRVIAEHQNNVMPNL